MDREGHVIHTAAGDREGQFVAANQTAAARREVHITPQSARVAVVATRYGSGPVSALPASTVAQLTGLSLRQLRYLVTQGLVRPTVRAAAGSGTEALYAPSDLLALIAIERVRAVCGQEVRTERLSRIVGALGGRDPRPGQRLVLDAEACWILDGDLDAPLRRTTAALVLDIDALTEETHLRLQRAGVARDTIAA